MTWESTLIALNATLTDAIRVINESRHQICLVTDSDKKLAGTITDGDVRRALLRSASMTALVSDVMNAQPFSVTPDVTESNVIALCREKMLRQIPIVDADGQIIGLHHIHEFSSTAQTQENWVILMAGGTGTRLRPLTENSPKPLLTVGDKPLLEGIIENFVRQGFSKFFISVNYLAESIKDHFGDGAKWGAHIIYLDEDKPLGTAGALKLLPEKPTSPVIVMNGDLVTKIDFRDVLDFHSTQSSVATMCVREYDFQVPFGVVETQGAMIQSIDEKPVHKFFVNAGIYVIDPDALEIIPDDQKFDMTELFDQLVQGSQPAAAFPVHEYWMDIGRLDDFHRANKDAKMLKP